MRLTSASVHTLNDTGWDAWPADVETAAIKLIEDAGIDPEDPEAVDAAERDWLKEAVESLGLVLVEDYDAGLWYVCRKIS